MKVTNCVINLPANSCTRTIKLHQLHWKYCSAWLLMLSLPPALLSSHHAPSTCSWIQPSNSDPVGLSVPRAGSWICTKIAHIQQVTLFLGVGNGTSVLAYGLCLTPANTDSVCKMPSEEWRGSKSMKRNAWCSLRLLKISFAQVCQEVS